MRYMKNVGDNGEEFASKILEEMGYRITARNYSTKYGEIDIIAVKEGVIHFVEVKTRTSDEYGYPSDSISEGKKNRMRRAAECYLTSRRSFWRSYSIDVFEVMANLITNCV